MSSLQNDNKYYMKKKYFKIISLVFVLILLISSASQVVERFPKPDFKSGYTRPVPNAPEPRSLGLEYLDIFVLWLPSHWHPILHSKHDPGNISFY